MTYTPKVDDFVFMATADDSNNMSLITDVSDTGFLYITVSRYFHQKSIIYDSDEYRLIVKDSLVSFAEIANPYWAQALYATVLRLYGKKKGAAVYIKKLKEYILKNYSLTEDDLKPGGKR